MTSRRSAAVTVVVPTCGRPAFLSSALASVRRQDLAADRITTIVVDDSPTPELRRLNREVVAASGTGAQLVAHEENLGPGATINAGLALVTTDLVAVLPDDDLIERSHLRTCLRVLDERPDADAVFGTVRWHDDCTLNVRPARRTPLLRTDLDPDDLTTALDDPSPDEGDWEVASGNFLALAQVVLRTGTALRARFVTRAEEVSDDLEYRYWRHLLGLGAEFVRSDHEAAVWTDHPWQHHKLISGRGRSSRDWGDQSYGLSCYRQHYRLPSGQPLRWRPARRGKPVDETPLVLRTVSEPGAAGPRAPAAPAPMGILVAGSLGYYPDRLGTLVEAGHRLGGTWLPDPPFWDTAGPLALPGIADVPLDDSWSRRVGEVGAEVVHAQLAWHALPFLHRVFRASRAVGLPFVLSFKESPQLAQRAGYWPLLAEMVREADGCLFASRAELDWVAAMTGGGLCERATVLDVELPRAHAFGSEWTPTPIDDDRVHTVSIGRPVLPDLRLLDEAKIDVHVYAQPYMLQALARQSHHDNLHLHPAVPEDRWTTEFSRYDAAWCHALPSRNGGDVLQGDWPDLNVPARLASHAAAGLPWIIPRNAGSRTAVADLASDLEVGLFYDDPADLARGLAAERLDRSRRDAMRRHRLQWCFDHRADELVRYLKECTS